MRRLTLLTAVMLAVPTINAIATEPLKLEDETARINYSLGYQIGGDFKRQGVEMNAAGGRQGHRGRPLGRGAPDEARGDAHHADGAQAQDRRGAEEEGRGAGAPDQLEESKKFLEENAKKPGVVTTESGLQYEIVEEGSGKTPAPTDTVTVNYKGTLINGHEFDSSYSRGKPATFQLNGVIKGWTEGLQHIKEGGKIKLFIPSKLAYGDRGPLAHRALIYDVELISVGEKVPAPAPTGGESGSGQ